MTDVPVPASPADPFQQILADVLTNPVTATAALGEAKSLLESRTIWAALVGVAASFLKDHGHVISAADQLSLVNDALSLIQYGGFVGAILFRVLATKAVA